MPVSYQALAKMSPNVLTKETLALYIITIQYRIVHTISDEFRVVETELLIKLGQHNLKLSRDRIPFSII